MTASTRSAPPPSCFNLFGLAVAALLLGACSSPTPPPPPGPPPVQNRAPGVPVLTAGTQAVVGVPHAFTCTAQDPEGEQVRYRFQWSNGTREETEAVPSGQGVTREHVFTFTGAHFVRCLAVDASGLTSTLVTVQIYVDAAPPPPPEPGTLRVAAEEGGSVTGTPGNIDCGTACSATFAVDTQVSLTAQPWAGWRFVEWTGDCQGTAPGTSIRTYEDSDLLCTARFERIRHVLSVTVEGMGTVTSLNPGISCPGDCEESLNVGHTAVLTATASSGWRLSGWTGDCTGTSASVSVRMDAARQCKASFTPAYSLAVDWMQLGAPSKTDVVWSPDGTKLAGAEEGDAVRIWDAETGRVLRTLGTRASQSLITQVAWSPDGTKLAVSSEERTVRIWDATTGELLRTTQASITVAGVTWRPGRTSEVTYVTRDGFVFFWDISGTAFPTARRMGMNSNRVTWSADGHWLASEYTYGETIEVHNITLGNRSFQVSGKGFAWAPTGTTFAVGRHASVEIFEDINTPTTSRSLPRPRPAVGLSWSGDGTRLAVIGGYVLYDPVYLLEVIQTSDGATVASEAGYPDRVTDQAVFHPSRSELVTRRRLSATPARPELSVQSAADLSTLRRLTPHPGAVRSVAFSPDGTQLLTVGAGDVLRRWTAQGTPVRETRLSGASESLTAAWTSDGTEVMALTVAGQLHRVAVASDTGVSQGQALETSGVTAAALSPDRTKVAFSNSTLTEVADVRTGARVSLGAEPAMPVNALAWSPNGRWLAGNTLDSRRIIVWDVSTGERVWLSGTFLGGPALAFSPDGSLLATSDFMNARLWEAGTWAPRGIMSHHGDNAFYVKSLAWRPGSTPQLATGDDVGTLRIWNVQPLGLITTVRKAHFGAVMSLDWHPDGQVLASGGDDFAVKTWRIAP